MVMTESLAVANPGLAALYAVLIVAGSFAVLFVIAAILLWQLLKGLGRKVEASFAAILPFEQKRAAAIREAMELATAERLPAKKAFLDSFAQGLAKVDAPALKERRDAKDTMDFALIYLGKVFATYGTSAADRALAQTIADLRAAAQSAYLAYGRAAASYNAVLAMWPARFANRLHRKNRREKAFLF